MGSLFKFTVRLAIDNIKLELRNCFNLYNVQKFFKDVFSLSYSEVVSPYNLRISSNLII